MMDVEWLREMLQGVFVAIGLVVTAAWVDRKARLWYTRYKWKTRNRVR